MKLKIFHIALSVALFCVLTAIFTGEGDGDIKVYPIEAQSEESVTVTGDGFKCIGAFIEIEEKPKMVRAGDETTLIFKGEPYSEYTVKVYYGSEPSVLSETATVKANGSGRFEYALSVSESARAGKLKITVLGETSHLLTEIEIVD